MDVPGVATKGQDSAGKDTLSVDFPDEDIRTILRNVADLFELNIIIPESLQGKTSIKLRDVTWRQIFQNVLAPVGFTYVEDGNIIKIVSKRQSAARARVDRSLYFELCQGLRKLSPPSKDWWMVRLAARYWSMRGAIV